jgi:hypothetical protein
MLSPQPNGLGQLEHHWLQQEYPLVSIALHWLPLGSGVANNWEHRNTTDWSYWNTLGNTTGLG